MKPGVTVKRYLPEHFACRVARGSLEPVFIATIYAQKRYLGFPRTTSFKCHELPQEVHLENYSSVIKEGVL